MFRRRFLAGVAGSAVAGLTAGCVGESGRATEAGGGAASGTTARGSATGTDPTGAAAAGEATSTGEGSVPDVDGTVGEDGPAGLSITAHDLYRDGDGIGLRGSVENTGDGAYGYVEAEVILRDDRGVPLAEFVDEGERPVALGPGDEWAFDVALDGADASAIAGYTVSLDAAPDDLLGDDRAENADLYGEVDEFDPAIEVTDHRLEGRNAARICGCADARVEGTVENVGRAPIESVEASVTVYDAAGAELGRPTATVEERDAGRLAPGGAWEFRVPLGDVDLGAMARYVVGVESTSV